MRASLLHRYVYTQLTKHFWSKAATNRFLIMCKAHRYFKFKKSDRNAVSETVLLHFWPSKQNWSILVCVYVLIIQCCYYLLANLPAGDGGKTRDSLLCWGMKYPGSALLFISPHYYPPFLCRKVSRTPGWDRDKCSTSLSWKGWTWVGGGWEQRESYKS